MKRTLSIVFSAFLLVLFFWLRVDRRQYSPVVRAAEPRPVSFLIRFGVDGAKGIDWSGSIAPRPDNIAGWQFDAGDQVSPDRWKCVSKEEVYWDTPYETRMQPTSNRTKFTTKGVVAVFDARGIATAQIATAQGTFSFRTDQPVWAEPQRFLNGRVEVRSVPAAKGMPTPGEVEDFPSLLEATDGTAWLAYQSWTSEGDRIMVRRRRGGDWSAPEFLSEPGDVFRTAVAQDGSGNVWVVWSAQVNGNFDLYGRSFDGKRWSPVQRLTDSPAPDIFHVMTRDRQGNLYLAYQSSRAGNFDIYLRIYDGKEWSREIQVSSDPANDWEPALAAAPDGSVAVVWDTYSKGNYDVVARVFHAGRLGPLIAIADSGAFEARASAVYDAQSRLWIAWDEGDWNWGKDYGNLIPESGRGILARRQVRVAVYAGGKLAETAAMVSDAIPQDLRQVFQHPRIAIDGGGNPWVFFHYRVNLPKPSERADDTKTSSYRALWRLGATSYQNGRWIPLIEFPDGHGRIDSPIAVAPAADGSTDIAWVSDGRLWPKGFPLQQDLYVATAPAGPPAIPPELVAFRYAAKDPGSSHANEREDVSRARSYRATVNGRTVRIARGDVHRHTDISWDGNRDGSLDDSYRYALDAAAFDFLGVCDHQGGQSIPYNWWRIQKAVDLYTIPGRFAPLYSYERSLPYPNGHRNVLFAERSRPILEISKAEVDGEEGAGKLYAYLKRLGGITTAHTSATGAGTDWRDRDPEAEPVVELYQGYRNNYEEPNAPRRAGANEASRFAKGMVWNAWAKGIKLGVQSSSDHVSTHISYAAVYVEQLDRAALLEGLRARRSYAATDNLIVDFRIGNHLMGESFSTKSSQPISLVLRGTGPIARVSLIRDNRIIHTVTGSGPEMRFSYTDADRPSGQTYYYVRIEQADGQLGWSSPIWVEYR